METLAQSFEGDQPRKYLFDLAFDNGSNKRMDTSEKPKPTYSQEQLDEAKRLSYEQGLSAGQKAMMEDQQQYSNVLLSQIGQKLTHVIDSSLGEWQRQLAQLQEIALIIARKVMPTYIQKHGLDEIESIVAKVIAEMGREPRLVFRVNETQFDDASVRINAIAEQAAYSGKLVILGDPELDVSDCRIEWADGGIERDVRTLWQNIDRVMEEVQTFESTMMMPTEEEMAAPPPAAPIMATPEPVPQQTEQELHPESGEQL